MRVTKEAPPTDAQAKRLASMWGDNRTANIGKWVDPTDRVLLRRGWLTPTGMTGIFPNGDEFFVYRVAHEGLRALATYFISKR
jgi:hypothetical protein